MNQRLYCVVFYKGREVSGRTRRGQSTTYGRRNVARGVEKDGHVDESDPAGGISPVERVYDTGKNRLRCRCDQRKTKT